MLAKHATLRTVRSKFRGCFARVLRKHQPKESKKLANSAPKFQIGLQPLRISVPAYQRRTIPALVLWVLQGTCGGAVGNEFARLRALQAQVAWPLQSTQARAGIRNFQPLARGTCNLGFCVLRKHLLRTNSHARARPCVRIHSLALHA